MPTTNQNITLCAGDSVHVVAQLRRVPVSFDMNGASASWAMGAQPLGVASPTIQLTKSTSDGSLTIKPVFGGYDFVFSLDDADTDDLSGKAFYHELEVVSAGGDHATVMTGRVFVQPTLIR